MPVEWVRRISYGVPYALIALLVWFGNLPWWGVGLLAGTFIFAWDWLWGDRNLLEASYGMAFVAVGVACLAVAFYLAHQLDLSLGEFQKLASGLARRQGFLYHLPMMGVGLTLYGLLILSRAWLPPRNVSW